MEVNFALSALACMSPPEILDIGACAETYTPAVDMWSVGVLLYILLSGNSPFDNEDERALFQTIKSGEYSWTLHLVGTHQRR